MVGGSAYAEGGALSGAPVRPGQCRREVTRGWGCRMLSPERRPKPGPHCGRKQGRPRVHLPSLAVPFLVSGELLVYLGGTPGGFPSTQARRALTRICCEHTCIFRVDTQNPGQALPCWSPHSSRFRDFLPGEPCPVPVVSQHRCAVGPTRHRLQKRLCFCP